MEVCKRESFSERRRKCSVGLGIPLTLFSACLGSVKGLMVSEIRSIGPIQIFGLRSLGAVVCLLPLIAHSGGTVWFHWKINCHLFFRALIGNVAVLGYYYGFSYLPLADASLIFYSTPVFTTLIGWGCLREKCGLTEVLCVTLCSLGVLLVSSPAFLTGVSSYDSPEALKGVIGAVIGAVAQAVALVVLRKLSSVSALVVSFWWSSVGVCSSLALGLASNSLHFWDCGKESALVVLIAVVGLSSEVALVLSLYLEEASKVSLALTTEILWAFVLQSSIQQQTPSFTSIMGAMCIVVSLLGSNLRYFCDPLRGLAKKSNL